MAAIKSKNTKPEMVVRKLVHSLGFRYRLHRKDLPGTPDLVFISKRKAIFVHGCYWHMHNCRYGRVVPKTNAEFWKRKRTSNIDRDKKNRRLLRNMGWKCLIIWECQLKNREKLQKKIFDFLN